MKKSAKLMAVFLLMGILMGCGNQSGNQPANNRAQEKKIVADYTLSLQDMPDIVTKNSILVEEGNDFDMSGINGHIDSVSYTQSLSDLEQNFFEMPEDISVKDNQVEDENTIILVNMTLTNTTNEKVEFAGNSLQMMSFVTKEVDTIAYQPFYQNPCHNPEKWTQQYFFISLEPNVPTAVTVGFVGSSEIHKTAKDYLVFGTTGSTSDQQYAVELPQEK